MRRSIKTTAAVAAAASLGLVLATALAQPFGMAGQAGVGHGPMAGPVAMLTQQDAGSAADMNLVHELLFNHGKIKRSVTRLPDGIRTVTESDDPQVAQAIKAHVASMSQRLESGREFNIFSKTLPVLFDQRDKIRSKVVVTDKGSVVTRTSSDPQVVAALQGHAAEVSELVQDGMVAMRRGMMSRMAAGGMGGAAGQGGASALTDLVPLRRLRCETDAHINVQGPFRFKVEKDTDVRIARATGHAGLARPGMAGPASRAASHRRRGCRR